MMSMFKESFRNIEIRKRKKKKGKSTKTLAIRMICKKVINLVHVGERPPGKRSFGRQVDQPLNVKPPTRPGLFKRWITLSTGKISILSNNPGQRSKTLSISCSLRVNIGATGG